ncbi:hypothetical protein [Streptomyces albospinus]|uniref:hypothetical protein n=1 Tax=Streptomyces albospinus TaxID=285515 RepID=UPI001E38726C|nr:hypothetical protein [Streptomyces albospinus]
MNSRIKRRSGCARLAHDVGRALTEQADRQRIAEDTAAFSDLVGRAMAAAD